MPNGRDTSELLVLAAAALALGLSVCCGHAWMRQEDEGRYRLVARWGCAVGMGGAQHIDVSVSMLHLQVARLEDAVRP